MVTVPVFVGTEAVECLDLVPKPKPFWKFWEKTEYEYKYTGQTRYTNKTEMRKLLQIHMVSGDVLTVAEYEGGIMKYRIEKRAYKDLTLYYAQKKILWWWQDMVIECKREYNVYHTRSREKALAVIEEDKKQRENCESVVTYEYIE